jgi:CHAD domain-containing protein
MSSKRSYRLKHGESPAASVQRIALGRVEKAIEALRGSASGEAAAVHTARKELKKIRSLVRLVRRELGEERYRLENRRYRDIGRNLSGSRDAVVKLETLAELRDRCEDELPRDTIDAWREALERDVEELGEGGAATRVDAAIAEIEIGRDEVSRWEISRDSWKLLAPGLRRSYKRGRRAMERVAESRDAEDVHEWRKRVKDLWYQLRLVRGAWPGLLGETTDQAHELADLLGDHHDLTVLAEDLDSRDEVRGRKRLRAAIEDSQEELLDSALGLGGRLYAERPKAFLRRVEAYWEAWRRG